MSNRRKHQDGISRREFMRRAGLLGLVAAGGGLPTLAGCVAPQQTGGQSGGQPQASEEPVDLTHFVWVGGGQQVVPREVIPQYMEEHPNVDIEFYEGTNAVTYPKMVAAKQADPDNPLINFGFFNVDATVKGTKDDMWVSLDPEKIPNMSHIYEGFRRPDNKGIGWGMVGIGLMYNSDLVEEPPTSWLDILDPRFKGKVVTFDYGFNLLLAPLAYALGGDANNTEEAWELLSQAAADGQFLALGSSNEDIKSPVVRGEALIAPWFNALSRAWAEEGAPLDYAVPKEGQVAFPLFFQIVKGSTPRQLDVASDIINTYLEPATLSRYCNVTKSIPASPDAELSEELADDPAFQPEAVEGAMQLDWDTMAEKDSEWRKRWDREVKANMA